MNQEQRNKLFNILDQGKKIVFLGGAGTSTDSGLLDFRSNEGLYKLDLIPEKALSRAYFTRQPVAFYRYLFDHIIKKEVKPHLGHQALAALEEMGKLTCIITQNIDGLHQKAGSKRVLEMHGTWSTYHCERCNTVYRIDQMLSLLNKPHCQKCNGLIRPDVILYGDNLPEGIIEESIEAIKEADVLLIAGTSLRVYPVAYLPQFFSGKDMVIINGEPTQYDQEASLVLYENFQDVMEKVLGGIEDGFIKND